MKSNKINEAIGMIKDEYIEEAHEKKKKTSFVFNWELVGKLLTCAACLLLVVSIIPGLFGRAKSSAPQAAASYDAAMSEEANNADIKEYEYANGTGTVNDGTLTQNKKLILTSRMEMETLDLDKLVFELTNLVDNAGGYFQSTSISNNYYNRFYEATVRIPAEKYEELINSLKGEGQATYYNEQVDDITDTYADIEARLNSLKAEESRVLDFYNQASSVEELMSVEERLTEIRYEIESYEASIKNYDLLVAYSTLNITIRETKVYSEENEKFGTRLFNSLKNGWSNFVWGLEDLAIDIAYNIWTILLLIVVAVVVIFVYKKLKNRKNKKLD